MTKSYQSRQPKAAADASLKVYYEPRSGPLSVGELRSRSWRNPVLPDPSDEQPGGVWHKRSSDYWIRQGQLYGFEPSTITVMSSVDPLYGPVITTLCVVMKLLPGRRERRVMDEHSRH